MGRHIHKYWGKPPPYEQVEEYKSSLFYWFFKSSYYTLNTASVGTGSQTCEGFVENSGVRIHYRAAGQGPLLLLLHGFPDNGETFKAQMAEFSKKYTVVCPTLCGFPSSDVLDDVDAYDLSHVVGDMVTIIGHFKAQKVINGGHDFGGAAIQMLAMMALDRIAGLILINKPIVPRLYDLVNFDEGQQKMPEYTIKFMEYQPGNEKNKADVVKFIRDPARRQAVQEYMRTSPVHGMFAYYKKNYPGPPYGQKVDTSHMRFQVPTLIIWGVEDEYFSPKFLEKIPQFFLAATRLNTLPGGGHWPFQEQTEKVNQEIWSWLDGLKQA